MKIETSGAPLRASTSVIREPRAPAKLMDLIRERGWVGEYPDMDRGGGGEQGCVVTLVSNLPEELANVTNIFNMVGMYGDVVAVKILRNKPDCDLVQCAKPHHAPQVRSNLDQAKVGGKKVCVSNLQV